LVSLLVWLHPDVVVFGGWGEPLEQGLIVQLGPFDGDRDGRLILGQEDLILYFFPDRFAITMGTSSLNWALIGDLFGGTVTQRSGGSWA